MNTTSIFPPIIACAGVLLLGTGIISFFRQLAKIKQYARAEGIVTDLIPVRVENTHVVSKIETGIRLDPKYRYRPEIRFKPETGQPIQFISHVSSRPPRYKIGEQVKVLYHPQDPADARLNSTLDLWFSRLLLVLWGLFAIVMGMIGWLASGG